jgi:hypothetical protein
MYIQLDVDSNGMRQTASVAYCVYSTSVSVLLLHAAVSTGGGGGGGGGGVRFLRQSVKGEARNDSSA